MKMLKQKTTWVGIGVICLGIYQLSIKQLDQGVQNLLLGVGVITGRQAISKLQ